MITSYATLQSEIQNHVNRDDLSTDVTTLIQLAEDDLRLDERVTKLTNRATVLVSADGTVLPSDLWTVDSWYLDGPEYYGPIQIVGADVLATKKATLGDTGAPAYAAIVDGVARYAPAPDGSYSTKMTYRRRIIALSDTNTTNWLLQEYPSIYLYAALVAAEPFLKNDDRVALWASLLEKKLEGLHQANQATQFGGTLSIQRPAIG